MRSALTFLSSAAMAILVFSGASSVAYATETCPSGAAAISSVSFTVNGNAAAVGAGKVIAGVAPGDTVTATFTVAPGCSSIPVAFSSFKAAAAVANAGNIGAQTLANFSSGTFAAGVHTLSVTVPTCFFQIDLYQGAPVTMWDLPTVNTFLAATPTRWMLGVANGGTTSCANTATPVTTPAVLGFQSPPQAPSAVTPAGPASPVQAAPASVNGLPSTSTASSDHTPLALLGLALVAIGLMLLRTSRRYVSISTR